MARFKSRLHKRVFSLQVFSLSINPYGLVSRGGGWLWDPRQVGECLAVKERKRRLGVELGVVGFGGWGCMGIVQSAGLHTTCKICVFQKLKTKKLWFLCIFGVLKKRKKKAHVNHENPVFPGWPWWVPLVLWTYTMRKFNIYELLFSLNS